MNKLLPFGKLEVSKNKTKYICPKFTIKISWILLYDSLINSNINFCIIYELEDVKHAAFVSLLAVLVPCISTFLLAPRQLGQLFLEGALRVMHI